jgi:CheY-like chemotaxis protein
MKSLMPAMAPMPLSMLMESRYLRSAAFRYPDADHGRDRAGNGNRIRTSSPDMPILLMTGYAEQRERAEPLMQHRYRCGSEKPFSLPQIRQAVAEALSAQAA